MGLSCSSKARKAFQVGFDVIRLAFEEDDRWLCRELARDLGWAVAGDKVWMQIWTRVLALAVGENENGYVSWMNGWGIGRIGKF